MKSPFLFKTFRIIYKSRQSGTSFLSVLALTLCASVVALSFSMNVQAADRLVIKNDAGDTKLKITDNGEIAIDTATPGGKIDAGGNGRITINGADTTGVIPPGLSQGPTPGRLDIGYGGQGGGNLEVYGKGHGSRPGEFRFIYGGGDYGLTYFFHYNGSQFRKVMELNKDRELVMWAGATSDGQRWLEGSSRELKNDIKELTTEEALDAFKKMQPVTFKYKTDPEEDCVGFIAEDVPDIVATKDRKSLNAMDIVGVLTKVVQDQQNTIQELSQRISTLESK